MTNRMRYFYPFIPTIALILTASFALPVINQTEDQRSAKNEQPNIVLIMADDLGYGDISPFDGQVQTPHLEDLASNGIKLTDFHTNAPVCSPTRAALMTGRYQQRAGIPGIIAASKGSSAHNHGLQDQEYTIAEALSDAGYSTGVFGKWHLGYYRPYNPVHHGFDRFRGFVSGQIDYFAKLDHMGHYDWWLGDQLINESGYVPYLLTKHARRFIRRQQDRPFFLYLPHGVPHAPYQGPDDEAFRIPFRSSLKRIDRDQERAKRAYREMVKAFDRSVGRVVKTLKNQDLLNNTFIFVFSDNGATGPGSNGSLRGGKKNVFEGGHRVPAIARYPGHIEGGTTTDEVLMTMDLMPTAIEMAGASVPEDHKLDGINMLPALTNREEVPQRDLYWSYNGKKALRRGPWKLILSEEGINQPELYHLGRDIDESQDLSSEHPGLVEEMKQSFYSMTSDLKATATRQPEGQKPPKGALDK